MKKIFYLIPIASILLFFTPALAEDGTYDATVTTDSGTYTVPVEVEDGEVTHVDWPNGGNMTVQGADLQDGEADGTNLRGDSVHIELDDPQAPDPEEKPQDAPTDN